MSARQTTTTATLGQPKAGDITGAGRDLRVPIDFGGGESIIVTDPAWARQLANAALAAANVLESVLGIDLLAFEPEPAEPPVRPVTAPLQGEDGTRVTIQRACNGCGDYIGDATPGELAAAQAGQPLPDVRRECVRCRGELVPERQMAAS
ncbi:hypothetical protein [Nonomuraea roseoviolacea]|uniref:Uncharacterized protein n=1 Tax=Nonomuraea roseoviolacea subsp. carminata TaxID=160689 RepID=A0ABT1K9I6_9ACTN|nr:hypothetical protein [Nonomuraea roseoviolacea]MCP2350668.1 hypothetical protein [Nonomuraea roseoviolacea subsp. carminata]